MKINDNQEKIPDYPHYIKFQNYTHLSDYDLHILIKFLHHNKRLSINDVKTQQLIFNTVNKFTLPQFDFNIPNHDKKFFDNYKLKENTNTNNKNIDDFNNQENLGFILKEVFNLNINDGNINDYIKLNKLNENTYFNSLQYL